jgi:hypothetical protein
MHHHRLELTERYRAKCRIRALDMKIGEEAGLQKLVMSVETALVFHQVELRSSKLPPLSSIPCPDPFGLPSYAIATPQMTQL